ncbi:hypothetical protein [Klebsiella phage 05F01]|nr:hypothetical protein [Klebsiella phage 05F01]
MTIKFDKVKKENQSDVVTKFRYLGLGETFMYEAAYRSDGLDLETNVLFIKTDHNTALELNYTGNNCTCDDDLGVVAVDLEVSSVKLKGEK